MVPYQAIKSSMINWRRGHYPANPTTLDEFKEQLTDEANFRLLTYNHNELTVQEIVDGDGCQHLIIYDQNFLKRGASRIFIDGTFQCTPRIAGATQLVTIMAVTYSHVSILFDDF